MYHLATVHLITDRQTDSIIGSIMPIAETRLRDSFTYVVVQLGTSHVEQTSTSVPRVLHMQEAEPGSN